MTRIFKGAIFIILAALIGGGLWALFPGEKTKIRRQLTKLAELATITGKEGNLRRIANASSLASNFSPDTEIDIQVRGFRSRTFRGREEVQQIALAAMAQDRVVRVEFHDIIVSVSPDKTTATADLTATIRVHGEPDFGLQELRFLLRKESTGWLIARVETLATFR